MSSSQQQPQQQTQQQIATTPSSQGIRKKQLASASSKQGGHTLQLNKRLQISNPQTSNTTGKNKAYSVIRTIEQQMQALQNPGAATLTEEPRQLNLNTMMNNSSQQIPILYNQGTSHQMFTYEPPSTASHDNLIRNGNYNINHANRVLHFAQTLENSQERHPQQIGTSSQNLVRISTAQDNVRVSMENKSYQRVAPRTKDHSNTRGTSKQRHPSRGQSNQPSGQQQLMHQTPNTTHNGQKILLNTISPFMGAGMISDNSQPQTTTLQQYQSIPVKTSVNQRAVGIGNANFGNYISATNTVHDTNNQQQFNHVQLKNMNKQASTLMKMYGNSGNLYRKNIKSVERKNYYTANGPATTGNISLVAPLTTVNQNTANNGIGATNFKIYQQIPNQIQLQMLKNTSQSNSKLSSSFQVNNLVGAGIDHTQRKSLGGITTLNNSVISGLNIYDSSLQNLASLESHRNHQRGEARGAGTGKVIHRNLNQSQTYNKFKVKTNIMNNNPSGNESNSFRKGGLRLSSKNVLQVRYTNQHPLIQSNQANSLSRSIQPLEEIKAQFNYEHRVQSSSNALNQQKRLGMNHPQFGHFENQKKNSVNNHTNLLIQQNEMYGAADNSPIDILNRSAGQVGLQLLTKSNNKHQTMTHLSRSAIASSARRLPVKNNYQESAKQVNNYLSLEQTPGSAVAATDTVMYLRQQEIANKSRSYFDEGKRYLLDKNYKEALKSFNNALKHSPTNKDAKYYRAICFLDSDQTKKCIQDLNELIEIDSSYNQTIYVVLSIAYRRENDLNNALRALTKGIQKFPKYVEAYQARGQINIYMKKFDKALIDFQHVINLQPYNGSGYIGQADSMKGIGNFKGALQSYNQAISVDSRCRNQGTYKRGVLLYQLKNYDQSLIDFEQLLDENDKNAKAHYYKGKILKKQELENEAILHFEQVIKYTTNNLGGQSPVKIDSSIEILASEVPKKISQLSAGGVADEELAGNALFEIAKIRINQRDFYEAFHNLQRAIHYDFRSKKFLQYKMFVEGVLFLMKRKVKKGVKMLTALIEGSVVFEGKEIINCNNPVEVGGGIKKLTGSQNTLPVSSKDQLSPQAQDPNLKPYLVHLIHVYRSYGYVITQQFEKALIDLYKASKIQKLDQACVYNKYITQSLIKMEKKDLAGVREILYQAEQKFPLNKDPYKFQAICIVQGVISDIVDIDNPKKKQAIIEAKVIIDRAIEKCPKDLNLLYLRGLLLFYMHNFYEALIDLDAVIDLEEEATAKHYVARGRCHACLSMFQEAIADLSKAIELDEEIADAYFNRGKCAYLLGDTALAFLDFQKLILLEPKNPMVHIYAGNLLMTTGSYDDATKAFTNADSVQKSSLAYYQRSRCHIALANMDQALKDLNIVVERSPQDKIAYVDRECLQALKQAIVASQQQQNDLISTQNSPQTKQGFDAAPFEKAVITYTKLLNTQYDIESNITSSISAIRQHQQIIPNVKRIKIEKVRALRRKRLKEDHYSGGHNHNGGMKRSKKVRQAFTVNDQTDMQLREQAAEIEPYSYYKENIFGQEDFLLYRGIMNFYIGEYQKAINDFEASIRAKQDQKDDNNDETISNASNQTDLSDIGLCSLNVHECNFNIILCLIQLKEYKNALEKVSKLVHDAPKRYTKGLYLIRGLLYQALGNQSKSKGDIDVFQKLQNQEQSSSQGAQYNEFFVKKQPIQLYPFPLSTRLCSYFPEIRLTIPQAPTFLHTRPSFSFPFVKPPNMIPNVEESILVSDFSLKSSTAPKPEAPWIKRCDYGIKFTDEIQVIEGQPSEEITETEMTTNKDNEEDDEDQGKYSSDQDEENPHHLNIEGRNYNNAEENERYYLRSYVREQRRKMIRAYSERLHTVNNENLFQVTVQEEEQDDQEETENPMMMEEDAHSMSRDIQAHLREHLYGPPKAGGEGADDSRLHEETNIQQNRVLKNKIIDDNNDEEFEEEYVDDDEDMIQQ